MPLIDQDDLHALHEAVLHGGLAVDDGLVALFEGLAPGYVATLPASGTPATRLLRVLGRLNQDERLRDGTVPLRVVLKNAAQLSEGRREGEVFHGLLQRLDSRSEAQHGPPPLRLLFLSAQAESEGTLDPGRAYRAIEEAIAQAGGKDKIHLVGGWAVRPTDLLPQLDRHRPHLVHLHAHGSTRGMLFEWEDERSVTVKPEAMEAVLRAAGDDVRLVFFGGCHSARLAQSAVSTVDFAVGMNGAVEEKAESRFAATFYGALSAGKSVQSAFVRGLAILDALGLGEQDTPLLRAREGRDAAATVLLEDRARARAEPHGSSARSPR